MRKRIIVVTPSTAGSKGDEGMLRGLLQLLNSSSAIVLNTSPGPSWLNALGSRYCDGRGLSEIPGPLNIEHLYFSHEDALLMIGADVIDGTCGIEPSIERLQVAEKAIEQGAVTLIFCSFRSNVDPLIIERIKRLKSVRFLLRDKLSLLHFKEQTGMKGEYFPDLFNFCEISRTEHILAYHKQFLALKQQGYTMVGLNFSEHSFRSFFENHTDKDRRAFVAQTISGIRTGIDNPYFILISNDSRSWNNFPSDHFYQLLAQEILSEEGSKDSATLIDPAISYPEVIALAGELDTIVTGRMHLSLACMRASTIPIVMMGTGKSYSSVDKMQGMFRDCLGDADLVCSELTGLAETLATLQSKESLYRRHMERTHMEQTKRSPHWKARLQQRLTGR